MKHQYICPTENETIKLGSELSKIARVGDVFLLNGTLGMGKTTFARSFIQELSGTNEVPSPTFTLLQCYSSDRGEIYHYDLYRIKKAEEIFELGIEEALYGGISLIEWPEKMERFIPRDVFNINIYPAEGGRLIEIEVSSEEKSKRLKSVKI